MAASAVMARTAPRFMMGSRGLLAGNRLRSVQPMEDKQVRTRMSSCPKQSYMSSQPIVVSSKAQVQSEKWRRSRMSSKLNSSHSFKHTTHRCCTISKAAEVGDVPETKAATEPPEIDPYVMDIRVGKILKCYKHPEADSLYVEEVDVGDDSGEPRQICSGLVKYVDIEEMQDATVTVLCNLKPRNMRGIASNGMLLCASNDDHDCVELLQPPSDAIAGERVRFGSFEVDDEGSPIETVRDPETPNRVNKKKMWEAVQPHLKTDENCIAGYKGSKMMTSKGPVKATTLSSANIS